MLFILTGDVQTGKSRWLAALLADLAAQGVPCFGVLAPGVWVKRDADKPGTAADRGVTGEGAYEKVAIENVLLPEGERIEFGRRVDLLGVDAADLGDSACRAAAEGGCALSAKTGLVWEISDAAVARVNAHFEGIADQDAVCERPGLLVVDEVGRLELSRGEGLVSAVAVLEAGATPRFPHALIVVRRSLADRAQERFADAWGGAVLLAPGVEAQETLYAAFDLR